MRKDFSLSGKHVLVVGLGASGEAAADVLLNNGAKVCVTDSRISSLNGSFAGSLKKRGARISDIPNTGEDFDLVIVSPGIPYDFPLVKGLSLLGIKVWSEVELSYQLGVRPLIAVTGTNGKTTTVSLLGEIFKQAGRQAVTAGNIGTPLCGLASRKEEVIAEISSFQLERIESFSSHIAVILNIADDHFDRHEDLGQYLDAKWRLFSNQGPQDWAVINYDQAEFRDRAWNEAWNNQSRVIWYSATKELASGFYISGGSIYRSLNETKEKLVDITDFALSGSHNLENGLAAVSAASLAGIGTDAITKALRGFEGLEHRMELVENPEGIRFYNDSKATNPHAVQAALKNFKAGVHLLLGGRNKGNDFAPLVKAVDQKVKAIYLFGEAASELEPFFAGDDRMRKFSTMKEAVKESSAAAGPGETVLLSPGCAGFDEFADYKHRGNVFKEIVKGYERKRA